MTASRRKPRVVVVGSANVDLTCFTDRLPAAGETIFGDGFHLGFGGKGANQAVAAGRCGADVAFVGRLGDDLFGAATLRNFAERGIDTTHVKTLRGVASGVAPIFVDRKGENRIVVVKGANDRLTPRAVDLALPLIRAADVLVLQYEVPLETVYHALRVARRHGVRTILNPAPALAAEPERIRGADYFVPNESEAGAISGREVRTIPEAKRCVRELLAEPGFGRVIVTLGKRGAVVAGADGVYRSPGFKVTPRDTTGAGDAFIGSFAVFLSETLAAGRPEREAVARANLYAALSTTAIGTQTSLPSRRAFNREWRARNA